MLLPDRRVLLDPRYEVTPMSQPNFLRYFIACQLLALAGLSALFVTAVAGKVRRYATWKNFCLCWMISCSSYLLLLPFGQQTGDEPNHALCLSQATLIYGAPVLTAFSTLSLVLQLWLTTTRTFADNTGDRPYSPIVLWLLGGPWIVYVAVLTEALVFGLASPDSVRRVSDSAYCGISTGIPGTISSVLVALCMVVTLIFEVLIGLALYKNWRVYRARRISETTGLSRSLIVRVALFSVCEVGAIGSSVLFAAQVTDSTPNALLATMPLFAVLIFGTQKDVFLAWAFWRKDRAGGPMQHAEIKSTDSFLID